MMDVDEIYEPPPELAGVTTSLLRILKQIADEFDVSHTKMCIVTMYALLSMAKDADAGTRRTLATFVALIDAKDGGGC
jgi:glyceraldehyde-3-phosphate dehydrogenase/erythrose-4-phosphate dehydrogenase